MPDCIFVDKIPGIATHSPEHGRRGFVEVLEDEVGQKLYVVHRLDKGTSGAMIFAKNPEAAAVISALFEQHQVGKKYLFLTDKVCAETSFTYESYIEKDKGHFVSVRDKAPNSKTTFQKIKSLGAYELWQAIPHSGKPHQIRLHAAANGIPVVGDQDHGGKPFHRLCLHSLSLDLTFQGQPLHYESSLPVWAYEENLAAGSEEDLVLLEAVDRRQRLYNLTDYPRESLRLSHHEIDSYRIDQFGPYLWVYWYKESDPTARDMERFERLSKQCGRNILIRKMLNRGEEPNAEILWNIGEIPESWDAEENGIKYELRTNSGLSPGLFLDQRENRRWIREHAEGRRVLNLFSYTSGFSVGSALAGAQEVCTVDVSQNFLDWSKKNFVLNGLNPEAEKYEFWNSDCLLFLKGTQRRKRKFNLIVCDPPSFGRSKNGVFSISKNFDELMLNCLYCLEKNGLMLFCTNYEKWTTGDIHLRLNKLKNEFSFKVLDAPPQGLDYELPGEEPLMKSVVIRKN